jgi:hypothetical protein
MRIRWIVTRKDVRLLRSFIRAYRDDRFVRQRYRRNVRRVGVRVSKPAFWRCLFGALATTQQPSGKGTPIDALNHTRPFPLRYAVCIRQRDLESYALRILRRYGLRRGPTIARQLSENLELLEGGMWTELLPRLRALRDHPGQRKERELAHFLADHFTGLGPKQSRNLLQNMGLSRYEVPLDSRFVRWLRDFGFPVPVSAAALADPEYYEFVLDAIQELCRKGRVFPCILDAVVFTSFDRRR